LCTVSELIVKEFDSLPFVEFRVLSMDAKYQELFEKIKTAISETVNDKKIGIAFSGGVDSTLISKVCSEMNYDITLLTIGFSESPPELGDPVCAIGNAFGLGLTVTCGVVSGLHKAGVGFNAIEDFVQTDAAVNPGASGGALVNRSGKLVGVLSAIFTKKSDANIGVNFAVSSSLALKAAKLLQESKSRSES